MISTGVRASSQTEDNDNDAVSSITGRAANVSIEPYQLPRTHEDYENTSIVKRLV